MGSEGFYFGNYYLLGRLSEGGMAEVFLGRSLQAPDRLVVIKRSRPRFKDDRKVKVMLSDEARIAATLDHENIYRVLDEGVLGNQPFMVMEFIHGKDLGQILARAERQKVEIPLHVAAFVTARIADALHSAHIALTPGGEPAGIVHRDVNPRNIILGYDGVPKLIDFGIVKAATQSEVTSTGVVKGKFSYMAPEQISREKLDGRCDVFALGVVAYKLCTGEHPFGGEGPIEIMQRICKGDFDPPEEHRPAINPELSKIITRSLALDPDDRYADARSFGEDLKICAESLNPSVSYKMAREFLRELYAGKYERESRKVQAYLDADLPDPPPANPGPRAMAFDPTAPQVQPDALTAELSAASEIFDRTFTENPAVPALSDGEETTAEAAIGDDDRTIADYRPLLEDERDASEEAEPDADDDADTVVSAPPKGFDPDA